MPVPTEQIGRTYPPFVYAVGREKIREYAASVGESEPLYLDLDAARKAGYDDLVAPPMFAVVYCGQAFLSVLLDPVLEIDFSMLVHGSQEFRWDGPVVVAGDEIATTTRVAGISERAGLKFYVLSSESVNQRGETVCAGTWTTIIRGEG